MSMFLSRVLILCLIWSAEIVKFLLLVFSCSAVFVTGIGADFRFEVPGQNSVGLIGGGRGQWLGGTMASAEHEPIMGVWGQSPQRGLGAEPLVRGASS